MTAKLQLRIGFLLFTLMAGLPSYAARRGKPHPELSSLVAKEKLATWMPATQPQDLSRDGTVLFLSDGLIVLTVCDTGRDFRCPRLVVLQLDDSGLRHLASRQRR